MIAAMNDIPTRANLAMNAGARTPEELEVLFEDTLLLRDPQALAALFEEGAVFVADEQSARGGEAIAWLALAAWDGGRSFVAEPQCVIQARDISLIVAGQGLNVMRRGSDGTWRYAIIHYDVNNDTQKETTMTEKTVQTQELKPVAVARNEGQARWWFDSLAVIKASSADTGGQMTIIEITEPPNAVAPLHVHHREDEGFWILEGDATFEVGGTTIEAHAGDFLFGPRDIPHRYSVGPAGCRMLFIVTPGGFEDMVVAMSKPAASRTLPPPSTEEPDWARVAEIAKAYGNELLG
jgi:quercetin dioxygenase-like cupin family protein